MNGPGRWIVTEIIQQPIDCEMVTKYSPIFFFWQILMNISLIYAIIAIKHDFSIHQRLLGAEGPGKHYV